MRKIAVQTFVTLDGVMQAPGGPGEDPSGGFAHEGWSVNYWDERMGEVMDRAMEEPYDLLLGRRTYDIFAAHWPRAGNDPIALKFNAARKYVATSSPGTLTWKNSEALTGGVAAAAAALRSGDGPTLSVQGSSQLVQTLLANDLVDELSLDFPVGARWRQASLRRRHGSGRLLRQWQHPVEDGRADDRLPPVRFAGAGHVRAGKRMPVTCQRLRRARRAAPTRRFRPARDHRLIPAPCSGSPPHDGTARGSPHGQARVRHVSLGG